MLSLVAQATAKGHRRGASKLHGKCVEICGGFFFCDQSSMDTPVDVDAAQKREAERRERERAKHRRYYEAHKDVLREKAHQRYFKNVHNTLNPPPLRTNMKLVH